MADLVNLVTSPAWWISTTIVAFVVNIAAAYAKPILDQLAATWSTMRKKQVKKRHERESAIDAPVVGLR